MFQNSLGWILFKSTIFIKVNHTSDEVRKRLGIFKFQFRASQSEIKRDFLI